jgi:hypothetical protein
MLCKITNILQTVQVKFYSTATKTRQQGGCHIAAAVLPDGSADTHLTGSPKSGMTPYQVRPKSDISPTVL